MWRVDSGGQQPKPRELEWRWLMGEAGLVEVAHPGRRGR